MDRKIKVVMFDLDGTLLPMDQDLFVGTYFKLLAKKMAGFGYEPKAFVENVWKSTYAMIKNDGKISNEKVFWKCFVDFYGEECLKDEPTLAEFYENEFLEVNSTDGVATITVIEEPDPIMIQNILTSLYSYEKYAVIRPSLANSAE